VRQHAGLRLDPERAFSVSYRWRFEMELAIRNVGDLKMGPFLSSSRQLTL
jgi:hypothetical protein